MRLVNRGEPGTQETPAKGEGANANRKKLMRPERGQTEMEQHTHTTEEKKSKIQGTKCIYIYTHQRLPTARLVDHRRRHRCCCRHLRLPHRIIRKDIES